MEGMSYWHEPGAHPLQHLTLGQMAGKAAEQFGDREALVSLEDGVRISFQELLHKADSFAAGLLRLGLQRGDRVAIWGPNSWRWTVTCLAVARAGLLAVYMNPLSTAAEAAHCFSLGRVVAVVLGDRFRDVEYAEVLSGVCPELLTSAPGQLCSSALPDLTTVIGMSSRAAPGTLTFDDVLSSATQEEVEAIKHNQHLTDPDASCAMLFSSGTTGKSKAIVSTHRSVVNMAFYSGRRMGLHEKHHSVCLLVPMFHVFGGVILQVGSLQYGATIVIPGGVFNPARALQAARQERCSFLTGTPTMYVDLLHAVGEGDSVPDSLEVCVTAGAPLCPDLVGRMTTEFGDPRICNCYGLTETTGAIFQSMKDDNMEQMTGSVGRVSDSMEVKVVDEVNHIVPLGTPGELCTRGYAVMKEYYQNEEATSKVLVDGWLRTGDQFVLQGGGYGNIVGRLKDVIIRGGENIYPKEVEDVLSTHPDVVEAEVVSVPDPRMGEEVCACLRVREGTYFSSIDLKMFCREKLAPHKIPRYSIVLEEFPKTMSGKIKKFMLRKLCKELLELNKLEDTKAPRRYSLLDTLPLSYIESGN